ncbi:GPI mannosyltransferase 1 [Drosophila virilis]|uniref:GPI alpha-1,4-mannosyltransferase I, catalytic subunit n=1 Tax=Drosophila virilis TaxID=7244 RepID=B4MCL3_DROVI|nr:GPI mannosyltransferase 1 [Drosophila virilis]EDW71401.1 uncharacterized protein Dvir_GJ19683 [Drosophila virilis]
MSETTGKFPRLPVKNTWLQNKSQYILHLSFQSHLLIAAILRLALIFYAHVQDTRSAVPYTDIDYNVVTDGARLALIGDTPFARHTYRYSPIMAYIQIPNVILHPACGKLFYALFDLLLGILIYALVRFELQLQYQKEQKYLQMKYDKSMLIKSPHSHKECKETEKIARISACFWLYNPLTAVISTRGNGDSVTSFFVLLSIYLLIKMDHQKSKFLIAFCAGLVHGFVIHLRLYPIVFSLTYYLSLSDAASRKSRGLLQMIWPNKQQICLVLGTLLGLAAFTWTFYALYGWKYIYEAYFYHLIRKDVRHNFSLHFLLQYLSNAEGVDESNLILKLLVVVPQLILILYLSLSFGRFQQTLPFCAFSLAFVIVTYNSVVTSQYFIWYLALLPVCIKNFQRLSLARCASLLVLWLCGQALWLLPAYLLEFKTWHTFYWIGIQSSVFFLINSYILSQLLRNYRLKSYKINCTKCL